MVLDSEVTDFILNHMFNESKMFSLSVLISLN